MAALLAAMLQELSCETSLARSPEKEKYHFH
jgi:hypothetical protein